MSRHRPIILFAAILFAVRLVADEPDTKPDPNTAFTNADAAGPDFLVQGEYVGQVTTGEGTFQAGAQVIALGDGKFHFAGHKGGLPGAGWNGEDKIEADGQTSQDTTMFLCGDDDKFTISIDGGEMTVKSAGGASGRLKRTIRESPTLGEKPPAGAVVLFDGSTAEHFEGGQIDDEGLLMPGVTSIPKFQSCRVHLEFRTPFMPYAQGQARGNSGCYLQGRYEAQILDSFGLEGKNNEAGGIYETSDPSVNMCLPPLSWQTYDIDYTAATFAEGKKTANAKMTVRLNGVVVQQDIKLPNGTRGNPVAEGPEPGPIYLQDHGNPVRFRNVWVVER